MTRKRAVHTPLTEAKLDNLVLECSPALRRLIAEAEADVRAGRVVTWREFLEHERRANAA